MFAGRSCVCRHEQKFCLLPSLNHLFSSEALEQERPAYRDKMNDVRFLCIGEGMAAVLNACDVMQERPAYRDKMDNVRFLCNGEGVAAVVYACDVIQSLFMLMLVLTLVP